MWIPLSVAPSPFTAWKYVGSQLLAMMLTLIIAAPYAQLVHTMRCFSMAPGIIARAPTLASQAMKSAAVAAAREAGVVGGVVLRLETPVEAILPFLPHVGMVTLLGTRIGVKGQSLAPEACGRLGEARRLIEAAGLSHIILAADGGIRETTVPAAIVAV